MKTETPLCGTRRLTPPTILAVFIIAGLLWAPKTPAAQAPQNPHWCGLSYRRASYAFGAASGYAGREARPPMNDEGCFGQGRAEGSRIQESFANRNDCYEGFVDGMSQGWRAELHVIRGPSECSNIGYEYGRNFLTAYARAGKGDVVGSSCVSEYRRGLEDGRRHWVASPPDSKVGQACYLEGHADAPILAP